MFSYNHLRIPNSRRSSRKCLHHELGMTDEELESLVNDVDSVQFKKKVYDHIVKSLNIRMKIQLYKCMQMIWYSFSADAKAKAKKMITFPKTSATRQEFAVPSAPSGTAKSSKLDTPLTASPWLELTVVKVSDLNRKLPKSKREEIARQVLKFLDDQLFKMSRLSIDCLSVSLLRSLDIDDKVHAEFGITKPAYK